MKEKVGYMSIRDVENKNFDYWLIGSSELRIKDMELSGIESSYKEVDKWFNRDKVKGEYIFNVENSRGYLPVFVNYNVKIGTEGSYGFDVYVGYDVIVDRRRKLLIYDTGLRVQTASSDYVTLAVPRSSIYKYSNIAYLVNSVGVIDDDYTGTVKFVYRIRFNNLIERIRFWLGDYSFLDIPKKNDRIGQIILVKAVMPIAVITNDNKVKEVAKIKYRELERGDKGFGSTGK